MRGHISHITTLQGYVQPTRKKGMQEEKGRIESMYVQGRRRVISVRSPVFQYLSEFWLTCSSVVTGLRIMLSCVV